MARGRPRGEPDATTSSVLYDRILAALKPDREITAGEFLKRAFTFPQIEKIKVQKFAGGTWNFAEDIDNIGPAFDPGAIEAMLREKYGPWRFRLLVIVNGETVTQYLINLDGWQENEARSAAALPTRPMLTPMSRPVGIGATSELLTAAKERVEIENTTRLLRGLERDDSTGKVDAAFAPMQMMAQMMTAMVGMMKDMMTMQRGGVPQAQEDRFVSYLTDEVRFMREQMAKPVQARDPDALSRTITTIDSLLEKTLNTSLAEILSGTPKTEATGWAATIQGVIEGLKPYLPDMMAAIKAAGSSVTAPTRRANVIPLRAVEGATSATVPPTTPEEAADVAHKVDTQVVEVVTMLIDALRSKNFKTIDAILMNPPLQGRVVIDPDVSAVIYTTLFKSVDPRFGDLQNEIAAYQAYMHTVIAESEKGE